MSDSPEGKELEKTYSVKGHPTFAAMNSKGEVVDWWVGYKDPESFIASNAAAVADPTTVDQKFVRFAWNPTARDAATLGRIKGARGQRAEALALHRRALELDPTGPYHQAIFEQTAALHAKESSGVSLADVKRTADTALASPKATTDDKVSLAMTMRRVADREKDMKLIAPYYAAAIEATRDVTTGRLADARKQMLVDEALHIKGDAEAAVALKRDAMPEAWMTDAGALNEFAWWCFENEVNLVEAEALARKGVELSPAGAEKAQILDTVAEICNLRGRCGEAIELMRKAIKEDPTEEHYSKQLARFEKILAGQS